MKADTIMEINKFQDYITFSTKNKYSLLRFTKKDCKLNNRRKRQFNAFNRLLSILDFTINSKPLILFHKPAKKIKKSIVDSNKYQRLDRCYSYRENMYKDNSKKRILSDQLALRSIIVFDILPKEFAEIFSKKYIKFRENTYDEKRTFSVHTISDLRQSLNKIGTQFSSTTFGNLDNFVISKKHVLAEYFDSFSMDIIDLTPSFSNISYTLRLNEKTTKMFGEILEGNIFREGHFLDKEVKKKGNFSYSSFIGFFSRQAVIEDFICELKWQFKKIYEKEVLSTLDNLGIVLPSVSIYESKEPFTMLKNDNYLQSILNFSTYFFANKSNNAFIQVNDNFIDKSQQKFKINNVLIDRSLFSDQKQGTADLSDVTNELYITFSEFYVVSALQEEYDRRISVNNAKINTILQQKNINFGKLISLKKDTTKTFFLFDRFIGEYLGKKNVPEASSIFNGRKYRNVSGFPGVYCFADMLGTLSQRLKDSYEGFSRISDFFEKQLKVVESHSNLKTVKISIWVAFLSLLVAIITLLLSNEVIFDCIKNLFSKPPTS